MKTLISCNNDFIIGGIFYTSYGTKYNVDHNNTPDGNVVIANGASVTFDATGDILLAPGFEVQLGAMFEAK
jgi:hypothetical protein